MAWKTIDSAPKQGMILLDLGTTVPGSRNIRSASWISQEVGQELGEELTMNGGWIIWNTDSDWFVIGFNDPKLWIEIPA